MLAYRAGMRRTPRSTTLTALIIPLLVAACGVTLTGCGPAERAPAPTPTASATHAPLFSTDEEALAAAEEAYRKYLEVVDVSLATGDGSRLAEVATGPALESASAAVESWVAEGRKQSGSSHGTAVQLVFFDDRYVEVYACLDVSQVVVTPAVGSTGESSIYSVVVGVAYDRDGAAKVESEEAWGGKPFCD